MTFFKNKKQFQITNENRVRILKDIDDLANLPNGVFAKVKQYEQGYYIKIIVDKIIGCHSKRYKQKFFLHKNNQKKGLIKTNKDFISDFSIGLSHHLFGYFYSGYSAFISFILLGISDKMFGNINLIYAAILFAFPIGICFIPAYSAVFSKDVFLRYFEIFKKENEQWHRKWIYITIFFCIGSIIVFFSGIIIMSVIGH